MKRCARCKDEKSKSNFSPSKQHKDGLSPWCKPCRSDYRKAAMRDKTPEERKAISDRAMAKRDANKEAREKYLVRQAAYSFQKRYGISTQEYNALAKKQGGGCAICKSVPTKGGGMKRGALHVDHCHTTKAVRGLLCGFCNSGIGMFRDKPELLRIAADYLAASFHS